MRKLFNFKYDGGVLIAGDRLGAYGGLHRFRDIDRMVRLNENVLLTYTGDVADFQALKGFFYLKLLALFMNVFFSRIYGRDTA